MKSKKITYLFLLIFSIFGVVSFYAFDQKQKDTSEPPPEDLIPPLVQKELDKKLHNYTKTILDKCRQKAIEDAEYYIDSLVAEELKLLAGDTLKFPAKPVRPNLREPIILNDSTAIAPILK